MSAKRARIFDAFAAYSIIETRADTAPPGSCNDGARYLVSGLGGTATGLWAGKEGQLAIAVGANASNGWYFAPIAVEGVELWIRDEDTKIRHNGSIWITLGVGTSRFQDLLDVTTSGLVDGDVFVWDASNGVLFPQTVLNLISGILVSYVQATLDLDGTLSANSDTHVASQKATKTYVDGKIIGLLTLKGGQDCSANPNYPAATKGDYYVVTVAGKIGGASGKSVLAGDVFFATADNAGGTQAAVGSSWDVVNSSSLVGALLAANNLSDLANAATARTNLGLLRLIAFFFTTTPTASEVLALYVAADAFTIPANMSGSQCKIGTNPTATFAIDVQQNGSSIGTISINTSGVATFTTTSGTSKAISAGDVIKFVAPGSADATAANCAINVKGTL